MIDTAVILAAGRGSRLKELTASRSKAMVPIAGKPMIARVMDSLGAAGVTKFYVVAAQKDEALKSWCRLFPGVEVREQKEPKGSGDALLSCVNDIQGPFIVSACDSLMRIDDITGLVRLFEDKRASVALSVLMVPPDVSLESRSVVRLDGDSVLEFIEKPAQSERISDVTSLPLWVLSQEIWPQLKKLKPSPRGEYELPATFNAVIAEGKSVVAYKAQGRRDLTDARDFLALNRYFLREQRPGIQIHASVRVPDSVRLLPSVLVEEGCVLGENVTIGPEVYLERGVKVRAGVEIRQSVVTHDAEVVESLVDRVKS